MSRLRLIAMLMLLAFIVPILAACGNQGTETSPPAVEASPPAVEASPPVVEASPSPAEASPEASPAASPETSPAASPAASPETSPAASPAASPETSPQASTGTAEPAAAIDWTQIEVEEGATLRVSTWGNPAEQQINRDQFARFNEVFPDVEIQYEPIAQNFQTTMQADFAAGTNPDVLYIDSTLLTSLGANNQLLDLQPYMDQVGVSTDDFLGEMAELYVIDGAVYALPKDFGALALFVRNDAAEQAGIDPESIQTWDDWSNAAEQMTTGDVIGQCVAFETERVGALWLQQGIIPVEDNTSNLDDPRAAEAIQFWADMYQNQHAAQASEVGSGWCGEGLGQGRFALAVEGGWLLPVMDQEYADVEFTAIPLPIPEGGEQSTLVFTNGWGVAANTQYPNAAAALVLYLTSSENQREVLRTGFAMPTRADLLDDPYFEENPNARVLFEAGQYGRLSDNVFGGPEKKGDIVTRIGQLGLEPVFLGQTDAETALQQADQEVQSILDSQ